MESLWMLVTVLPYCLALPQRDADLGEELQCSSFSEFEYFCVPNWLCRSDSNFTINTGGEGLIGVRESVRGQATPTHSHEEVILGKCPKLLEVCCQTREGWDSFHNSLRTFSPSPAPPVSSDLDCELFSDPANCPEPPGPAPTCGKRNYKKDPNEDLDKAFVRDAQFGEWPHVCAVLTKGTAQGDSQPQIIYKCGASLLDDQVILTAAHCIHELDPSTLIVRCGEWDSQNQDEPLKKQDREVGEVKLHPFFRPNEHHNNFALLMVKQSFERMDHIHPVCLPDPCFQFTDEFCVTGGWGKDQWGDKGRYAQIQKEVVLPLMDDSTCQRELRKTRLGEFFELHSSFICAGGIKGVDTCQGDGGSPLTCRKPEGGGWFQAGIVSWGIGCNSEIPSVYASVAKATCWIDQQVTAYYGERESHFGLDDDNCDGMEAKCSGG